MTTQPIDTPDTPDTTGMTAQPRLLVRDMTPEQRAAYVAGLMGGQVRYSIRAYPDNWRSGILQSLTFMYVSGHHDTVGVHTVLGEMTHWLDDLHDMALESEPLRSIPDAVPERSAPDFDGEDVYAADEVACPHCGHTLRVVMRARLSAASADDEEDDEV